jgi:hypothetical protein
MSDDEDIDYTNAFDDPGYRRHDSGKQQNTASLLVDHVSSAPGPTAPLVCKVCGIEAGESVVIWRPERLCSTCQGKKNREAMDQVPSAIRSLKFGSDSEIAEATRTLKRVFGDVSAMETVNHIAKVRAEGKFQKDEKSKKGSFK